MNTRSPEAAARSEDPPRAAARPVRLGGRLAGDEGLWFFVAGDLCFFAVLFGLFMSGRIETPAVFADGRSSLHVELGLLATVVLITSSFLMARAVAAVRRGDHPAVRRNLALAFGVGSVFAVIKAVEWGSKFDAGIGPTTNDFYMYYFILTGLHFFHYLGGMTAIGITLVRARRTDFATDSVRWTESVGVFWHMVDLIWIFLFPMIYLLSAS